jgi:hypothetical protein
VGRLGQLYLVVIATIAWLAVAVQIFLVIGIVTAAGQPPIVGILNTLSYFTVLTNLLVALVATASAWRGCSDGFLTSPSTMTATAVYIFVVGLIYSLVLRALWEPSGLQLAADIALHDLVPTLYVVYWLFCVPKGTLRWDQPIHWLIYPLAYMAYTLVRGLLGGRCLYPFADVSALGYPTVLGNVAIAIGGFFVLGLIAVAIDHLIGRLRRREGVRTSS